MIWAIGRVCEEFSCDPDAAERLLLDDVHHRAERIITLRAFAACKASYDAVDGKVDKLQQYQMMDKFLRVHERRELARLRGDG